MAMMEKMYKMAQKWAALLYTWKQVLRAFG
jgi:hypothetical protein